MTFAHAIEALRSKKGVALLLPAVLWVWMVLAVGGAPVSVPAARAETAPSATAPSSAAPVVSAERRKEIEAVIKDYLTNNPEILLEMQTALEAKMDKVQAERTAAVIKNNAAEIFHPAFSGVVGNPKGDVTMIEFFDYNCGYCRRAVNDVTKLVDKEKAVKLILKEFPILSKGSEEASKVALAVKMQGNKYWEFHRAMLESQGQANEATALRTAEKVGVDMAKLKKDMASPEIKKEIDDTRALAQKLGIQGTPHFMIGDRIIPGAPENLLERMTELVGEVRQEGCKVC
ncbi:MAG: DsbA family protein [Hyphomicrobiaceae bacterium]|nr:DsbA family protein [Hyphomicrobiaceae bacterium]